MFISKFWTLLLAMIIGVLVAIILLAKDVVNRERLENTTAILYKEKAKVDVALKLHARERLDVLLSLTTDPDVAKSLGSARASDSAKASAANSKLREIMHKWNTDQKTYPAHRLIAVDMKGEVVCHLADGQPSYNMAGFPAVDAALRGYIRDDIWKLDKKVYLVAVRPVVMASKRYVGAIIHLVELNNAMATKLSPTMQLAFYSGDLMIAIGSPKLKGQINAQGPFIGDKLSDVRGSEIYKKDGYSEATTIGNQANEYLAVYSKVRGEAAASDVGFAVVQPVVQMSNATEFYEKAGSQDVDALPMVLLIGGVILATILGGLFNYIEGQRPVSKMLVHVKQLRESDPKDQLNVYKFRRKMRKVASEINGVMDYKMKALMESPDRKSMSIDSILGQKSESRLSSASFKFDDASDDDIPPPPPVAKQDSKPSLATGPQVELAPPAAPSPRPPTPPAGAMPSAAPRSPLTANIPAVGSPEEKTYFTSVYEDFVVLKKKLGEPVDQLTFDRFSGTLRKNRDTLIARYKCKQVKFQVYEKGGKASLKATPIKS